MEWDLAIQLLKEFNYEKNGKELTIMFLKMILEELEKTL